MAMIPSLSEQVLQAICDALEETSTGLAGTEIARLLQFCGIADPQPTLLRRQRLFHALSQRQQQDQCANNVFRFLQLVVDPRRYVNDPDLLVARREHLNRALAYAGYMLNEKNQFEAVKVTRTQSEAEQRAQALRSELLRRRAHADVLGCVRPDLLENSYTPVIGAAIRSLADKIRSKTGLGETGPEIVKLAFGVEYGPVLVFNSLASEGERAEHRGLVHLMHGLLEAFPDPSAVDGRTLHAATQDDALDVLTMLAYLHRRLDSVVHTHPALELPPQPLEENTTPERPAEIPHEPDRI
jgi:uncharacterized protein (TIGR02391 family)